MKKRMDASRRQFIRSLTVAAGSSALTFCARPSAQPTNTGCSLLKGKRIRWVVPHESGGGYDTLSRLIAQHLGTALDAQILVETRGGAGGLIGSQQIRDALPDGLTLGIVNASGLMAPMLAGDHTVPNLLTEFTVLCRVSRSRHIWATGGMSPLRTAGDLFQLSLKRPVIFPINDVGSVGFITATLTSQVLELPVHVVAGYEGSRSGILAALRGEVDVMTYNLDTIFAQIKSGEVRPVLQISDEPLSNYKAFDGVPVLGGPNGLAVMRARSAGRDVERAQADAHAIATIIGAGRLIVAPAGMDRELSACLANTLKQAVASDAMQSVAKAADLTLDVADGETAMAEIKDLGQSIDRFVPIIQSAIERIRQ